MAFSSGRWWMAGVLAALVIAAGALLLWPRGDEEIAFRRGDMVVSAPWARATPGAMRIGAAYLSITNGGAAPDRLLRAETSVAERVELHINEMRDGIMRMRSVESVTLPPRQPVRFEPSGMHMMLVNLAEPLQQGSHFPLRLIFERAGTMDIEVTVGAVGASEAPENAEHMNHGSHSSH